jgi:trans-aconitate 2-methyltransferase
VTAGADPWRPAQYGLFSEERSQPFFDLLALVRPVPGGRVVDLGCGTGELTAQLHERTGAGATVGVDSSEAMLAEARPRAGGGLSFEAGDLSALAPAEPFDVVFSNAALQWVPDHPAVLERLTKALSPAGQLAVQVPANFDHPSHTVAQELARDAEFAPFVDQPGAAAPGVLTPEEYATLLDRLGFVDQHVRLQVYAHHLPSAASVVEWTKGTALLRYQRLLPADRFDSFVDRYRERLLDVLGPAEPFFYPFKRILLWAARHGEAVGCNQ